MTTNKLKPEQIKALKEKEADVFKADEDGFIDIRNIEWFADEIFAAGDNSWGLEILEKIEGIAKEFSDLIYPMERLLKLNENDRLLALIKKAEPMIEKEEDYDVSKNIFRSSVSSGYYLTLANILLSIDKNRAVELYKKAEEKAVSFMDFIRELWEFLRVRKKLWLAPIIIVMLILGGLLIIAQGSIVAPFIYTIF